MQKLNEIQRKYFAEAEKLQLELARNGFATRIEKEEGESCSFLVIYFDGTHNYLITRGWNGYVRVNHLENDWYPNVSSHKRSETYQKHIGATQNMKVITSKKLQAKIDALNAYRAEMDMLNKEADDKSNTFIKSLETIDKSLKVNWSQDKKRGYIERNGLEFSFSLQDDGYVSKKITLLYSVEQTLDNFLKVSDNKYRA